MKNKAIASLAVGILVACTANPHGTQVTRYIGNGHGLGGSIDKTNYQSDGCLNVASLIKDLSAGGTQATQPALFATIDFDLGKANTASTSTNFTTIGTDAASNAIRANLLLPKTSPFFPVYDQGAVSDVIASQQPKDASQFNPFDITDQAGCALPTAPVIPPRTIGTPTPTPSPSATPTQGSVAMGSGTAAIIASTPTSVTFKDGTGRTREYRLSSNGLTVTITMPFTPSPAVCGSTSYTLKETYLLAMGAGMQLLPMRANMLNVLNAYKVPINTVASSVNGGRSQMVLPASYAAALTFLQTGKIDLTVNCPK